MNRRKHGVDFADAVLALEDGQALTILDPFSDEEERFMSARRATSRERRHYEG